MKKTAIQYMPGLLSGNQKRKVKQSPKVPSKWRKGNELYVPQYPGVRPSACKG